jgi:serine/threonine protein kinase
MAATGSAVPISWPTDGAEGKHTSRRNLNDTRRSSVEPRDFLAWRGRHRVASLKCGAVLRKDVAVILRADQELDGWVLIALLGRGGNGEVWRAAHQKHGCAALKVLAKKSGDRWPRFCDEVKVMQKLGDRRGVLPLRAAELSTRRSHSPAWLATPVAEPIVQALGSDASLAAVVAAGQAIAETLADLAAQEIFHRDIKPDNLFQWDGQWVIGDFGLVDYPEKAAITTGRRGSARCTSSRRR